jgi:lipopolysaccharide transport system permease protein
MGASLLAASVNVYIRDLENLMNLLFVILLFGTPIFYSLEIVPDAYVLLLKLNPLYFFVKSMRAILCFGEMPDLLLFAWVTIFYGVFYWMSLLFFRKLRKGFGDLL